MLLALLACREDPAPEAPEPVVLPRLVVEAPERGAFFASGDPVVVRGKATRGGANFSRLEINGVDAPIAEDGSFEVEIEPVPGVNVLGVRIEDEAGQRAVDGRGFHYAGDRKAGRTVEGGVRMKLGPPVLDDDEPTPNDLAAVAEIALSQPDVMALAVGSEFTTEYAVITVTSMSWGSTSVDMAPHDGWLELDLTLHDVWMDYDLVGVDWYDWVSTTGSAWADAVIVHAEASVPGGVDISVRASSATIDGFGVTIDWVPSFLEDYIAEWTQDTLEQSIAEQVAALAGEMLGTYLDSFGTTVEIVEGASLTLDLASVESSEDGLLLTLDGAAEGVAGFELPPGAGSLVTDGPAAPWPLDKAAPFAIAIDDDLLDQLLFALWSTGALGGMEFGPLELAVLAGAPPPPPLGPVATFALDLGLPPVITTGDEEHGITVQLGELGLRITREDGEVIAASISATAGGELVQAGDSLGVELDNRPAWVRVEAGVLEFPRGLDPGDLASLFRLMTPNLLGSASSFMPSFPIPGIPLDAFSDASELAGKEIRLQDAQANMNDDGWLIVAGDVTAE